MQGFLDINNCKKQLLTKYL